MFHGWEGGVFLQEFIGLKIRPFKLRFVKENSCVAAVACLIGIGIGQRQIQRQG